MGKETPDLSNSFFDNLYAQHGEAVESLGWSLSGQQKRFEVFANITSLDGKSVLDVGCGFADLFPYLSRRFIGLKYKGYEIYPQFFSTAKKKFGDRIEKKDIFDQPIQELYSAVFSIGMLNVNQGDNIDRMKDLIAKSFSACTEVAAVSMTSTFVDDLYRTPEMFFYNPGEMFNFARTLSKKVVLLHDYLPHDFTLVLKK